MEKKRLRKVRKGDPILAEDWNALVDMVIRNDIRAGGGLNILKGPNGTVLSAISQGARVYDGKTSSAISARVGTAAGSGTVTPQSFDGTDFADDGDDVTVYSWSGTAVASGKYCCYANIGGYYRIISAEC